MLLGTRKTLYDHITEALLENPLSATAIGAYLKTKEVSATVQGIYKALRELSAEDIVVKQKKVYSVSSVWREKLARAVSQKERFSLSPGEQISYKFRRVDHTDAFWKHTYADLSEQTGAFPTFIYMPHEFWIFVPGRRESEMEYFAEPKKSQVPMYTVIGGTNPVDVATKNLIAHEFHPVHLDPDSSFNRRDHIVVLGSYVILTRISVALAKEVDHIYDTADTEPEIAQRLEALFKKPTTITMVVEHNDSKAKKLRKQLSKDFYISSELRKNFDIF